MSVRPEATMDELAAYTAAAVKPPYELIGKMHQACTQIRLAIQVLEVPEMPAGESSLERVDAAMAILADVRKDLPK